MLKLFSYALIVFFTIVFSGCSGGGSSSDNQISDNTSQLTGTAYKGLISGAIVEVYEFTNNSKGELISKGTVSNSELKLPEADYGSKILIEIKKDENNTATYIDEDSGDTIFFNDLVLKSIIEDFSESENYVVTPLTTFATELFLNGNVNDVSTANDSVSKLFGLSFKDLHKIKPNIEGIETDSNNSIENEYALSLLALVALQNEIDSKVNVDFTINNLLNLIKQDLQDGVFDGKENNSSLTIVDGKAVLNIGDIPTKLSQAGSRSISEKNPNLLSSMQGYFLRAKTASRSIEPPIIEIKADTNIKTNEKAILSADGSKSPFGYPLTYAWSVKTSPENANVDFSSLTSSNTFITVNAEGNYTISLEISDGQNRVSKDYNLTADLDGDGLFGSDDLDMDGDGILNTNDKFQDNPAEFLDSDNDGTGNFSQKDEDGDSVVDTDDEYPFDENKSQITIFNEVEFNGNLNDANTLSGLMPYKISGVINATGADDDYFKFSSTAGSIISAQLTKSHLEFEPIISLVDSNGNPISAILTINDDNSSIVTFRIPLDGTFALIVTDKNSQSNPQYTYELTIFEDSDMDGVSNEYERAIGSNENSSDTDGDGIKDFYEINTASFDIDSDGIPNWLDRDSDNDTVKDDQETLTDYDNDGLLNPFDTDSDGNGILDANEVGTNPSLPLNTDGDAFADYIDLDDDNDGVLDINDQSRLLSADINSTSFISVKGLIDNTEIDGFVHSKGVMKIGGENFSSDAIVVLVDSNGVYNLVPTEVNSTTITVSAPDIESEALIRVYDNNTLTTSSNINIVSADVPVIFDISYPNSQTYALENDIVTINGTNLSSITSLKVNGSSVSVDSATDTTVTFRVNNTLSSGSLVASSLNDESNSLSIFIGREISGTVELPQSSIYKLNELKVKFAGVESTIDDDGAFAMIVNNKDTSSIDIFTPGDDNVSIFLSRVVFPDQSNIIIDANTTADSLMYSALNMNYDDIDKNKEVYNLIESNNQVFREVISTNIGNNPYFVKEVSDAYIDALAESKGKIYQELQNNSLVVHTSISRDIRVNEISDVSVWKDGDPINGKIRIENDTMVFLDYMVTNANNGKTIKPYLNQYYGDTLIGPQNPSMFMYWASSSSPLDVKFQSSVVTILSPKFKGMTRSNWNKLPEYKLAFRTVVSQVIFPIVNQAIGLKLSDGKTKILLEKFLIPAVNGGAIDKWASGKIGEGFYAYFKDLAKEFGTKKVQKALKKTFKLDAQMIADITSNIIGYAVPTKGVKLAGTAVDLGKTVVDFASIEDKMIFNVNFPILINDMYPSSIKKNGSNKIIAIEGSGLDNYCSDYDMEWINGTYLPPRYNNVCVSWHYPKVEISSNAGKLELDLNKRMDGQYLFEIPNSFIEKSDNNISVTVKHVHNDEQDIDELIDIEVDTLTVISIVNKLEISNISPDSGGAGTSVTISGAGFSRSLAENDVYFTTSSGVTKANIIEASESELKVQVPLGTITGDVWVQVDNEESNKLNFTVNTTQVTIQFGDNGGVIDDTFALELNGKTVKTMKSPVYAEYGTIELNDGEIYTVTLKGITAPDAVGTYYISFPSEIEVISGDSLSAYDLTAGVTKSWKVQLATIQRSINRSLGHSIQYDSSKQISIQPEVQ